MDEKVKGAVCVIVGLGMVLASMYAPMEPIVFVGIALVGGVMAGIGLAKITG